VFEKYWDYLPSPSDHPDFASESQYCQEQMIRFSSNHAQLDFSDFAPSPTAEATNSDIETAEDAFRFVVVPMIFESPRAILPDVVGVMY
jgi:hypothetical protein